MHGFHFSYIDTRQIVPGLAHQIAHLLALLFAEADTVEHMVLAGYSGHRVVAGRLGCVRYSVGSEGSGRTNCQQ
ncbi:hypothetical protein AK51_22585 [Serratia nematodiphila DZ0503SBS1]|nr:hypothetical protein AK51_22585 [Serratia nematodiphila DZ0503SBS1]